MAVNEPNLFQDFMSNIISLFSNNQQITFQRQEDGYINATALCNNANKSIGSYLRNKTTEDFLKELEADMQIRITELVQVRQGGEPHLQGTWIHPQVAINLAQWLSPKFAVQVSKWVQDWITKKQAPTHQLSRLEILQIAIENEKKVLELQNTVKEKDNIIQVKDTQLDKAQALFKQVADKTGCVKFKACARSLNIKECELRTLLIKNKWRWKSKHFPTADGVSGGYVKLQPEPYTAKLKDGTTMQKTTLAFYITEKGYNEILRQMSGIILN